MKKLTSDIGFCLPKLQPGMVVDIFQMVNEQRTPLGKFLIIIDDEPKLLTGDLPQLKIKIGGPVGESRLTFYKNHQTADIFRYRGLKVPFKFVFQHWHPGYPRNVATRPRSHTRRRT